jgi:adenosylcobinamide-GDP ribazoletransferase
VGAARRAANGAALAISMLTVVPLRARPDAHGVRPAAAWFPIVGAAVGVVAGGVLAAASGPFGRPVAAALATGTLVVLTGGLHQDGLADCADAIGVRGDRERRLAVMREPTIGTFGALALLLWGALLMTALAGLPPHDAVPTLVLASALGRWAALAHAATTRPARRDGLGAAFAVTPWSGVAATVTVLAGSLLLDPAVGLIACACALLLSIALSGWAQRTLGGRTGDTLGAAVVLAEVGTCLIAVASARG